MILFLLTSTVVVLVGLKNTSAVKERPNSNDNISNVFYLSHICR